MNNDYSSPVFDVTTNEFPAFAEVPSRKKPMLVRAWNFFREMSAIQAEHGIIVPRKAVAAMLDVSVQRVDELEKAGGLTRVDFRGHPYITENSIVAYCKIERKNGRPLKALEECARSPIAAFQVAKRAGKKTS